MPPTRQTSVKLRDFEELYCIFISFQIAFILGNFTHFKALFSVVSTQARLIMYEISNCSLQVSIIIKKEKNQAVEQESSMYDDLLVVFYLIIEVLLMKILPFFNV